MTPPDRIERTTDLLRRAIEDDDSAANELPAGRDEAIAALADALRRRGRRERRRRLLRWPLLAAAAIVLVGAGAFAVSRAHHGAEAAQAALDLGRVVEPSGALGEAVPEGSELGSNDGSEVTLHFESGTLVTVGQSSRVRLVEQTKTKRFALSLGSFTAHVAKLRDGERFVVATSDAEVEVRGTAFRVSITPSEPSCEGGTTTRLDVTEGVVSIRHAGSEARVRAGEHWPSCPAPAPSVAPMPNVTSPAPPSVATSAMLAPSVARPAKPAGIATPPSSHLAEQNDLFDDAMRRKRAGDVTGAVAQLDRLLASYPAGPLAESAAAERRRLLSTSVDAGTR